MATSSIKLDYLAIMKVSDEKNAVSANLLNEMVDNSEIHLASNTYEGTENKNSKNKNSILFEKKLKNLKQSYTEIKTKAEKQKELFFNEVDELSEKLLQLPYENNTNESPKIGNYIKFVNKLEQEIANAKKEMEIFKKSIEHIEPNNIIDSDAVMKIIQNDSVKLYGNRMEIQERLSEIRKNIESLFNKVQNVKS